MLAALDTKSSRSWEFAIAAQTAHKVKVITDNFFNYIASLKEQASKGFVVDQKLVNFHTKTWIKVTI
jgi:hypothetical protein